MTDVGHGLDAIAAATEQQRRVSRNTEEFISNIANMARGNTMVVEETAGAAHDVKNLADGLQEVVGRFRV